MDSTAVFRTQMARGVTPSTFTLAVSSKIFFQFLFQTSYKRHKHRHPPPTSPLLFFYFSLCWTLWPNDSVLTFGGYHFILKTWIVWPAVRLQSCNDKLLKWHVGYFQLWQDILTIIQKLFRCRFRIILQWPVRWQRPPLRSIILLGMDLYSEDCA